MSERQPIQASDFGYPLDFRAYVTRGIIWTQRKVFSYWFNGVNDHRPIPPDFCGQEANDQIRIMLATGRPCLVARFGCVELDAIMRGYDIGRKESRFVKLMKLFSGGTGPFWWDNSIRQNMLRTTGVFPADDATLSRFSARALEDSRQIDVIGSWNARELEVKKRFFPAVKAVELNDLNPFLFKRPWTNALAGKKVLVVHPFCETITSQYARRELLWADPEVLPAFKLVTYRPVESFLGLKTPYRDWFEALDKMTSDIAKIDFDVAIIGCGAAGMSIGAFVKRDLRRQAVHLGGVTQFLFGIRGTRWDGTDYDRRFYNEHWVRPGVSERPANFRQHEGGAYW